MNRDDLIERLALDLAYVRKTNTDACNLVSDQQQRIEELGGEYSNMATWLDQCREEKAGLKAQIAEYKKALERIARGDVGDIYQTTDFASTELERIRGMK